MCPARLGEESSDATGLDDEVSVLLSSTGQVRERPRRVELDLLVGRTVEASDQLDYLKQWMQ